MANPVVPREFGVQFKEAIDFLKGKIPEGTMRYDDLAGPVHAKVFAIAGATNVSFLSDIQKSLVSALENGTTITQFRKDFDTAVQKYGWTYKGKRGWRTALIFNTNMRKAHMHGRWIQLQANKANRPYLQYRTAGDSRVRPQHRAWNGLIYHIDDAFWPTHYPPNGLGCRCTVRAYSDGDLKSLGAKVSPPFELKMRQVVTRDGEIKDVVPEGIDPGHDHNVGMAWLAPELALGQKLAALPRFLQGPLVDKTISPAFQKVINDDFKAFRSAIKNPQGQAQIVGFFDSAVLQAVAEKLPDLELKTTAVAVLDRKTVHLSGSHKAANAPQQVWPDEWIDSLPENFRNYRAVLWDIKNRTLVMVPQGGFNGLVPKIVLRLNQKTSAGSTASVVSLGTADTFNLKDTTQYELLLGDVGR